MEEMHNAMVDAFRHSGKRAPAVIGYRVGSNLGPWWLAILSRQKLAVHQLLDHKNYQLSTTLFPKRMSKLYK